MRKPFTPWLGATMQAIERELHLQGPVPFTVIHQLFVTLHRGLWMGHLTPAKLKSPLNPTGPDWKLLKIKVCQRGEGRAQKRERSAPKLPPAKLLAASPRGPTAEAGSRALSDSSSSRSKTEAPSPQTGSRLFYSRSGRRVGI